MRRALVLLPPAVAFLVVTASFSHRTTLALRGPSRPELHTWVLRPEIARILALGENELWADLAWVRALLYYGDGLVNDTGMPDVEKLIAEVNIVDPRFRRPYIWGGYATVFRRRIATQEEYEASVQILRRGVKALPLDWEIHWLLGIRLYFDIKRSQPEEQKAIREEGAALMERAVYLPHAPPTLAITALAMRSGLGQRAVALRGLRAMILNTDDPAARKKLEERYAEMDSEARSRELADAANADDAAWAAGAPWAPRTLFHILGPPPASGIDLNSIARGEEFAFSSSSDLPDTAPTVHTSGE